MTPFPEDEEITRPDHITMTQWRSLISAFDSVPVEKREQFIMEVVKASERMRIK